MLFTIKSNIMNVTQIDTSDSSSEDEASLANPYVDLLALVNDKVSQQEDSSDSEVEESLPKKRKLQSEKVSNKEGDTTDSEDNETDVLIEESDEDNNNDYDGSNADIVIFGESDDEDSAESKDPDTDYYKQHFESSIADVAEALEKSKPQRKNTLEWTTLKKMHFMSRCNDLASKCPHPQKPIRRNVTVEALRKSHHIRGMVIDNWIKLNKENKKSQIDVNPDFFTPLQRELFTLFNSYVDVFHTDANFLNTSASIQNVYCLHAVNHVIRSRAKVLLNTARLKQLTPEQCEQVECRDQGITRPKVLILLPFKNTALKVVSTMLELLKRGSKFEVSYKKRFHDEFSKDDTEDLAFLKKPEDFQCLFAGNTDEHFRIGIALLRNSVKLYSPFYSSDIIVASPLGLRTIIGSEGEKHYEHDFLSSIELVILDHTDVFLMQNWEHILHIFDHLNITPKSSHGVDFSRVRNFSLDGRNKFYRQTIAISSVCLPQISSIFTKSCWNYEGCFKIDNMPERSSICAISKQLPQVFHKLNTSSLVESSDVRFRFFVDKIYKQYKDQSMSHTLIYVPQYFDFIRLRNFMRRQKKDGSGPVFGHINDYSTPTAAAKTKRRFYTGKCSMMLYTERFHFYNRTRIRGMRNLIFYELPTYPAFYVELCNMIRESHQSGGTVSSSSVIVMYTKYDTHKLSATVGLNRCCELQTSSKSVHMFVTGTKND